MLESWHCIESERVVFFCCCSDCGSIVTSSCGGVGSPNHDPCSQCLHCNHCGQSSPPPPNHHNHQANMAMMRKRIPSKSNPPPELADWLKTYQVGFAQLYVYLSLSLIFILPASHWSYHVCIDLSLKILGIHEVTYPWMKKTWLTKMFDEYWMNSHVI